MTATKAAHAKTNAVPEPVLRTEHNGCVIERPVIRATGSGRIDERAAAQYLGVSPRTLRKMRAEDSGPNFDRVAGRIWYPLAELDAWLELCRHETSR